MGQAKDDPGRDGDAGEIEPRRPDLRAFDLIVRIDDGTVEVLSLAAPVVGGEVQLTDADKRLIHKETAWAREAGRPVELIERCITRAEEGLTFVIPEYEEL